MKKWDEQLADMSTKLADLSQRAAEASVEAKEARELKQEAIDDRVSTARGNVEAFKERTRIANEENRGKLSSALLKAQMTIETKIAERKEAKDQKLFEAYIDNQIAYIYENFETACYLIENAELAILETMKAVDEYDAKHPKTEEVAEA